MGQYWIPVNLDKKEFIDPHSLACGLKLGEQLVGASRSPGTATALIILLAAHRAVRGGGDLDMGAEDSKYNQIATRTIGRWAGDRIALVGDYAEDADLPDEFKASMIYKYCSEEPDPEIPEAERYRDVTDDVCAVIEHELGGKFVGDGWRDFERNGGKR